MSRATAELILKNLKFKNHSTQNQRMCETYLCNIIVFIIKDREQVPEQELGFGTRSAGLIGTFIYTGFTVSAFRKKYIYNQLPPSHISNRFFFKFLVEANNMIL